VNDVQTSGEEPNQVAPLEKTFAGTLNKRGWITGFPGFSGRAAQRMWVHVTDVFGAFYDNRGDWPDIETVWRRFLAARAATAAVSGHERAPAFFTSFPWPQREKSWARSGSMTS